MFFSKLVVFRWSCLAAESCSSAVDGAVALSGNSPTAAEAETVHGKSCSNAFDQLR